MKEKKNSLSIALAFAFVLLGGTLRAAPTLQAQSPELETGKQIFTKGESPTGVTLEAVMGDTAVPATLMPCSNCHGMDGHGRPEGGVVPADITWSVLSHPKREEVALSRKRPAYDDASLRRVLREGIDAGGNELEITMPRYRLSDPDLDSLISFLHQLGVRNDPGVSNDRIRVASLVSKGQMEEASQPATEILRAYFEELNQQGGIYGRKIDYTVAPSIARTSGEGRQDFFAVVGVFSPDHKREIHSLEASGVPALDIFSGEAEEQSLAKPRVFHIFSGLAEQARMLAKYAYEDLRASRPLAIVYPAHRSAIADAVEEQCLHSQCPGVTRIAYSSFDSLRVSRQLSAQSPGAVLFLGQGSELRDFLSDSEQAHSRVPILQLGPLSGAEIFQLSPQVSRPIYVAFPTLPSDVTPVALAEYRYLANKYKLSSGQAGRALAALAAAKVFVETARQTGRELTRENFVDTLAGAYKLNTGLSPPLSYGSTRRIGALGAYVVKYEPARKTFSADTAWMEP